ncbi:MAG: RagB/SusD family nutrient uptake outer membrane protein [Gemmatimonadaceae bacterium]
MTNTNTKPRNARRAGRPVVAFWRTVAVLGTVVGIVACDTGRMLDVKAPNSVPVTVFENPANAALMVNSVIGDFECAWGGYVVSTGIQSDELQDATLTAANWQLDRRDDGFTSGSYGTSGCTGTQAIYSPMSTARWSADQAVSKLAGWTDAQVTNRVALLVQANVYAGFSYAALGMAMCQAAFDLGPLVDQKGMFALAEKRFSDAITAASGVASLSTFLNAAYAGRARVRLYQHNLAGAAADAALVPKGFVFNATMDANNARRYSHVYQAIVQNRSASVEPTARALKTERDEIDPRSSVVQLAGKAADGVSDKFVPTKYNAATLTAGQGIPQPITRYDEAQLILAEAQGGANAVNIINTLRATANLKPYAGATDAASITALIASERQRALFVEGLRMFDVERFNLPLVPAPGTAFRLGGVYGNTVCMPLPDIERVNNPNVDVSKLITGIKGGFPLP